LIVAPTKTPAYLADQGGEMWAQRYLRIPWSDEDRGENGTHCWGLVRLIYKRELGIILPAYGISPDNQDRVAARINSERGRWMPVPGSECQAFDVAIFSMLGGRLSHVGVFISGSRILQTLKKPGPHIIEAGSPQARRLVDVRRYRG
jgi:cell wall-associated NlpC family hydrolase